jgi:hypothetical protein
MLTERGCNQRVADALGLAAGPLVVSSLDEKSEAVVDPEDNVSYFILLSHYVNRARRRHHDVTWIQRSDELFHRSLPSALASVQITTGDEALFWIWWCVDRYGSLDAAVLFPLVQVRLPPLNLSPLGCVGLTATL